MISLCIEVEAFRKTRKYVIELRSGSVVDLRVVDVLVVNVILDMYELTTIGLSVIETLAGSSYPTRSWS